MAFCSAVCLRMNVRLPILPPPSRTSEWEEMENRGSQELANLEIAANHEYWD